jgi:puromycin-sensitive aminopeptidase
LAVVSERLPYRLPKHARPAHYDLVFRPDLGNASFEGEAKIELEVAERTDELLLNAAELDITEAHLTAEEGAARGLKPSYRPEEEQVAFDLAPALQPGRYRLELSYSGRLNDLLRGFYRSKFRDESGTERWIAATQFESTDARRAFPCWDEPEFKATFSVTVEADDGLVVLSNAKETSSEPLGNGRRRVRFARTEKLPTYLVALAIGPFVLTGARVVDGVPVRVACVPGRAELTAYALSVAEHSLSFLSNYLSVPYAFGKLDHVAIPDFAAGAMENAGLVTYREAALLVGDDSSQLERQRVASTIAHETAHMWFGDLVTLRWWEDAWLNEAFASFLEMLAVEDLEPGWDIWTNFAVDRAVALATDSLRASRPIEYRVGRPEEAEDLFDAITYDKGASVLRMAERHLGEGTFRRGLRLYLERHQFSNTTTTDLWDALEEASGQPVGRTMGTWVSQAGHPVLSVRREGTSLVFSQRRFLLDGGRDDGAIWAVPVTLRWAGAGGEEKRARLLLEEKEGSLELGAEPTWVVVNESGSGTYRVSYDDELRRSVLGNLAELDPRERLGLVVDMWAEAVSGQAPVGQSFELWGKLAGERDPDVWWAISNGLSLLDLLAEGDARTRVAEVARALAGPAFREVGWEPPAPGDPTPRYPRLRARLISLLGTIGKDEEVRAGSLRLLKESTESGAKLPPDLATSVAQVAASAGGEEEWRLMYRRYKEATTPQDELRFLHALGSFSDAALARRSVELAFSDDVRTQDAPYLLMAVLSEREGAPLAWEAVEEHWSYMFEHWPNHAVPRALEALPALAGAGRGWAERAEAWLASHPVRRGELRVQQSRERLRVNLAFKERLAPVLWGALGVFGASG